MNFRKRKSLPKRAKKLPATYRGVPVARGRGLTRKAHERLENERSCDQWPDGECYVVVPERIDDICELKVFKDKKDALAYARGCANGNVDHRVLRATSELFVIATENEL